MLRSNPMKSVIIPFLAFLTFLFADQTAVSAPTRRLSDAEIDVQLGKMQEMLPVQVQNGIRWIDIKRNGKEIKYTYIVNINAAELDENRLINLTAQLQDFGCRQLLPAMCQGLEVMFDSGLTASTVYHDNFGNFLFDCTFTPENCAPQSSPEE